MPQARYKVGICTDGRRHAVVRKLLSQRAACGAGRIVIKVEGEFDPTDLVACHRCTQLVREPVRD